MHATQRAHAIALGHRPATSPSHAPMAAPHLKNQLVLLQQQNQLLKHMLSFKPPEGPQQPPANVKLPDMSTDGARHQAAVSLLETAAAQKKLLQQIAAEEAASQSEAPPPLPCFPEAAAAVGTAVTGMGCATSLTAAEAVRSRYRSSSCSNSTGIKGSYKIPVAQPAVRADPNFQAPEKPALRRFSLSPPRRVAPKALPRMPVSSSPAQALQLPAEVEAAVVSAKLLSVKDEGESLPGSPYWTEAMNISDMPDGETSVFKDAEMKRMLKAWLLPRKTTQWCGNGQSCTLEQKVEQKRSRMTRGRTPMFMMQCG